MSQENVEIVRRGIEAYASGDLDAAFADVDPEVVWDPFDEPPCRGLAAVRAQLGRWEENWDDYEIRPEAYVDGGDRVLVTMHFRGRGKISGVETEARSYQVFMLRDGKAVSMVEFLDRDQALEAAGLSE